MTQCQQLLSAIWGGTTGNFRVFHDSIRDPKLARKFHGPYEQLQAELSAYNQQGYGVYFVVNHGGSDDVSITHATAIMIDIDNGAGLPSAWHVTPHILLKRGGNYHAYWLINQTTDMTEWSRTCRRLIAQYDSDRRIHNPSRVMRLPSFLHCKDPENLSSYQIIWQGDHTRYDLSTVANGLPEVAAHDAPTGQRGGVLLETDDPGTIQRVTDYLQRAAVSVEGDGGDHQAFAVAARCRDFGVSEATALQLITDHWNPRCEPPWMLDELTVKVGNAYQYASSPQGSANAIAGFMQAGYVSEPVPQAPAVPAVPQPTAVPAAPSVVPQPVAIVSGTDPYDITPGVGYEKNHTENACRFLQEWYPSGTLRMIYDNWYYFDGKSWVETTEASMRRGVAMAMMNAAPSNSEISGTLAVLASFVTQRGDLGSFGLRDTSNLVLLQNGILDAGTGQLESHSREFFSTNILPFAYDPSATCPSWDYFLSDIFDGDLDRIQFVQEWLGWMMVRDYSYQKMAMFIGVQRSGKTTIANIAKHLVGNVNYMGIGLDGFAQDGILESAINKTVLWVGDAGTISGPNRQTIVDRLKTITGTGDVSCSRKYKSAFYGPLPGRISITCNNVLSFNDDSGALADRFIICPFNKSFLGREDPTLERRLVAELPGIANRCIAALRDLRSRGRFVEPQAASPERESIAQRYSPVLAFIQTECKVGEGERVHSEELFARYQAWAARERLKTVSRNMFIDSIRSALRGKVEKTCLSIGGVKKQGFRGVSLLEDSTPDNVANMFERAGQ